MQVLRMMAPAHVNVDAGVTVMADAPVIPAKKILWPNVMVRPALVAVLALVDNLFINMITTTSWLSVMAILAPADVEMDAHVRNVYMITVPPRLGAMVEVLLNAVAHIATDHVPVEIVVQLTHADAMVKVRVSARNVVESVVALNVVVHAHAMLVKDQLATPWLNVMAILAPADVVLDAHVKSVKMKLFWPNALAQIDR